MIPVDCLRDCTALCCRTGKNRTVVYYFSSDEVRRFEARGQKLVSQGGGGYTMEEDCTFLNGNLCSLHGKPEQPICCKENKVGGSLCMRVRRAAVNTRWSEVE